MPTALIAEDEPLLAEALAAELARAWPALRIAATVGDGASAVREALALRPDALFLDIRMPGLDGLEAAAAIAEDWPEGIALPALVFVTAYDRHAVDAFEAQAVDYVLKPVQPARLLKAVARVQAALRVRRAPVAGDADPAVVPLQRLLAVQAQAAGAAVRMVPVADILVFEAADKYLRVLTADGDYLIRTSLRELQPQLPPDDFWQVHRGILVRATAIDTVERDDAGRLRLTVRGLRERFGVSRLHAARFRAM